MWTKNSFLHLNIVSEKDNKFHELPNKDLGYTTKDGGDAGEGIVTADDGKKYTEEATVYVICPKLQKNADGQKMITFKTKWVDENDADVDGSKLCGKLAINRLASL